LKAEENRDFILGLNPDLVYYVKQFWEEITEQQQRQNTFGPDPSQFHWYLDQIVSYANKRTLKKFKNRHQAKRLETMHNRWREILKLELYSPGKPYTCYYDK
jgi:hypothetical protein